MEFNNIIFGMDLSLRRPGFAVIGFDEEKRPVLLEKSFLKNDGRSAHGPSLLNISKELDRYIETYQPKHYVRERGFSRFPSTTQALFKVVGIVDLYVYARTGITKVDEIAPTSVKKTITGSGNAAKKDVQKRMSEILRLDSPDIFETDDESDACAVAVSYALKKKLTDETKFGTGSN